MKPMQKAAREFFLTVLALWAVVAIAAVLYSKAQHIPPALTAALMPAFLLEAAFYVALAFRYPRCRLADLRPPRRAAVLALTAILPYLLYAVPAGAFRWPAFAALACLALTASFWYVVLPRALPVDLLFLALIAVVLLAGTFRWAYPPAAGVRMNILGELMWRRLGISVLLVMSAREIRGFGFIPTLKEWAVGVRCYLLSLLPIAVLAFLVAFARPRDRLPSPPALALAFAGTFLGMLWVVALAEEVFFRGVLQEALERRLHPAAGLFLASLVFGLVHLPFRGFPNWRFALIAALAGLFYGLAYRWGRGVRPAMVTHALINTTWRVFFV